MANTKITTNVIADDAVTTAKIADNAITAAKIAAGAVVADIANDSIDSQHYVAASIDNEHLADNAVDSAELAAGSVDLAHMSVNSIDSDQYVDGSIDRVHLAADIVDGTKIADDVALGGNPTTTTQSAGNSTTRIATTAFVATEVANLIDSSPGALNTLNELAAAIGDDASFSTTVTNSIATKLPLAGGTMTGDLILGDSVKLEIGSASGGDLQLYHDGSDSYISDAGTGILKIKGSEIRMQTTSGENMAIFNPDGSVQLQYDNSTKLATASGGIDVTGAITATSTSAIQATFTGYADSGANAANGKIVLGSTSAYQGVLQYSSDGNTTLFLDNTFNDAGAKTQFRMRTNGTDVDALTIVGSGNVGIGTTSPAAKLHVQGSGEVNPLMVRSDGNCGISLDTTQSNGDEFVIRSIVNGTTPMLQIRNEDTSTNLFHIDGSNGNVGIGTASPGALLHLYNSSNAQITFQNSTTGTSVGSDGVDMTLQGTDMYYILRDSGTQRFYTANAERMRIGSTGKASWSAGGIGAVATQARDFTFYTEGVTNGVAVHSNDHRLIFMGGAGSSGAGMDTGYFQIENAGTAKIALNSNGNSYFNGGNVGIGNDSPGHLLSLKSTGDAGIHIAADSDNTTETDNPYLSMSQDGSTAKQFVMAMESTAGTAFTGSLANAPYIHADNHADQPLMIAHEDELCATFRGGKTGIGTSSPDTKLDVEHNSTNTYTCYIKNTNGSYTGYNKVLSVGSYTQNTSGWSPFQCLTGNGSGFSDVEFHLRGDGYAYADVSWNGGGADYAEFFEWKDGNPSDEERRGYSVILDGDKIVKATESSTDIIGIISSNPTVIGNSDMEAWKQKYLRDDYGGYDRDEDGYRKPNPAYDESLEYVKREFRKEWGIVGLMGRCRLTKGEPTNPNWIKLRDISATVEEWLVR